MKNYFKKLAFSVLITIFLLTSVFLIIRYNDQGEKVLPFKINRLLLVSTVDGTKNEDTENLWNIDISQVNDLYFYIDQDENSDDVITEIRFENFKIENSPQIGNVKILRPTGDLKDLYTYSTENYLDSALVYTGDVIDDLQNMEFANTGGMVCYRVELENLGNFISNEVEEVTYDGNLLKNLNISLEQIKFDLSFDIVITTSDKISYKGSYKLNLPIDTIIENGSSSIEITDFSDIVFKRI